MPDIQEKNVEDIECISQSYTLLVPNHRGVLGVTECICLMEANDIWAIKWKLGPDIISVQWKKFLEETLNPHCNGRSLKWCSMVFSLMNPKSIIICENRNQNSPTS